MFYSVLSKNLGSPHPNNSLHHTIINESSSLYITNTLRAFALALVGIFLPIYIYELSLGHAIFSSDVVKNGLFWILAYFAIRSVAMLLFIFSFEKYVFSRLTLRWSIFLSFFTTMLEVALWLKAEHNIYLIFFSAIVGALSICLYWVPFHIFFIKKFNKRGGHYGKEVSLRFLLVKIFSGIAPVIGGFIIVLYGFDKLFLLTILLMGIAGFPILLSVSEHTHKNHDPFKVVRTHLLNKKLKSVTLSLLGTSFDDLVYAAFWSLLLYLTLDSFTKLGTLNSFSIILSSLFILWVGSKIDSDSSKSIYKFSVIINSFLYIPRIIFSSAVLFYIIDIVDRLNGNIFILPRETKVYEKALEYGPSDFIIYREIVLHFGFLLATILAVLILILFPFWKIVFVISILGSLLTYAIQFQE